MKYDPKIHHRRSIRLKNYDYSQEGYYFITICIKNREYLLGDVINGKMILSQYGEIVIYEWFQSLNIRKEILLDAFIAMPNHVHGIVGIQSVGVNVGANGRLPVQGMPKKSLCSFVAGFKSITTKRINIIRKMPYEMVWQRNYYERIIRNEIELNKIRAYILNNPIKWEIDRNYSL